MVLLNEYLYNGDTVVKILHRYSQDLKADAIDNSLVNDGCGLYRGRLILPYEHLSRFQNDLI